MRFSVSTSSRRIAPPRGIALALSLTAMSAGAACFNFGDRPPPPASGGVISGTITGNAVTGALAVDPNTVRQERVDVTLAGTPAHEGIPIPASLARPPDDKPRAAGIGAALPPAPGIGVCEANCHPRRAPKKSSIPLEWKAGDVLVLFDDGAYNQETLGRAMLAMLQNASVHAVPHVVRCTAHRWCKVELKKNGVALDASATDLAQQALDKNRAAHVQVVAKNLKKRGLFVPDDPLFGFQWHYDVIHLQAAWDIEQGDDNLVVAVVDSGAVQAHPDLQNRWARDPGNNTIVGADLVSSNDNDAFAGRDTDPEDPGDNLFGNGNSSWHGTHIAGTIGAETNNHEGVAGITIKGKIEPVRVLGNQLSGFDDDIMDGIYWAVGDQTVQGVPKNVRPAKIVNLSLGGPTDAASQTFWNTNIQKLFTDPQYKDPILVAAAGNSDEDAAGIVPANVPGMIVVGATNINGLRASYSNFGDTIDIMAPGGDEGTDLNSDGFPDTVLSTVNPDYNYRDGTSMACPHVTGVIALAEAAVEHAGGTKLTQVTAEALLKSAADPHGHCSEGCGAGMLDAVSTLLAAGGQIQPAPFMSVDVTTVFFPTGLAAREVNVLNLGNTAFSFRATIEGAQSAQFSVTPSTGTVPEATATNPRVPLTVTVDRGTFEGGSANLKIVTTDATITPAQQAVVDLNFNDDPNRTPRVIQNVQVGAFKKNKDGTLEAVAQAIATRDNHFAYQITGLREGAYYVYAVGDDNNDGTYAADVESFGAYPSRDTPTQVTIGRDQKVEKIDFAIDASFITDIVGGVGAPCSNDNDCTFLEGSACIQTFAGGYCSRICDDGKCGNNGSCETLECTDDTTGAKVPCNVCLARCASDSQCRFDEGYTCDRGECVPQGF